MSRFRSIDLFSVILSGNLRNLRRSAQGRTQVRRVIYAVYSVRPIPAKLLKDALLSLKMEYWTWRTHLAPLDNPKSTMPA